jgi:hypothetical protein
MYTHAVAQFKDAANSKRDTSDCLLDADIVDGAAM